jgi:hypothetical protein
MVFNTLTFKFQTYVVQNLKIIYQCVVLLVHGRGFSPGTPTSSTTKTDRHEIAEILLKLAL